MRQARGVVVDGRLDDEAWQRAPDVRGLVQRLPREGEPASLPTRLWVARDANLLLIALRAEDAEPDLIRARRARRDDIEEDDRVGVRLDPVGDGRRAYEILVNPHGVIADGTIDAGGALDRGVDLALRSEASRDAMGWSVEIAIPLDAFLGRGSSGEWGLQVLRFVPRLNESAAWPAPSAGEAGALVRAGRLGVGTIESTRGRITVSPYVFGATDGTERAGLDLSWRPSPRWRADVTLAPDFSQVEADVDQVEVNARFALFFPEKRPFFLEGAELWELPFRLVHTRTMVDPAWGARLTHSSQRHDASVLLLGDDAPRAPIGTGLPEPSDALTGVARWRGGVGARDGFLGALATWRNTDRGENLVLSIDGRHRPAERHALTWQLAGSRTDIDSGGPVDDPSDDDWAGRFEWEAGERLWSASAWLARVGPDFVSALGFVPRTGFREFGGFTQRRFEPKGGGALEAVTPSVSASEIHGPSGALQDRTASVATRFQLARATSLEIRHERQVLRLDGRDLATRRWRLEAATFAWPRLAFGLSLGVGRGVFFGDPSVGDQQDATAFLTWRPIDALQLQLSATRVRHERDDGTEAFDVRLRRFEIEWQLTRSWRARLIIDDDTSRDRIDIDALVAWDPSPGRILYVGLDRVEVGGVETRSTAFLKLGWRFPPDRPPDTSAGR